MSFEWKVVLPCSSDQYEARAYPCFLQACLGADVKLVSASQPFTDEHAVDTRLEEGFQRKFRVAMPLPSVLAVLLGSLAGSVVFEVEEKVCFPFSRTVWVASGGVDIEVECLTMVLDDDRGEHVNALGFSGTRANVDFVDLVEEPASGCVFESSAVMEPFDCEECDPVCCVYVLATATRASSWAQARILQWIVAEPLVALCKRVVIGLKEEPADVLALEAKLKEPVPAPVSVSSPVRAKRVTELDGLSAELAEQVRLARKSQAAPAPVVVASAATTAAVASSPDAADAPQKAPVSVSPPMRVKKVEDLRALDPQLAEEIVRLKGPPPRDLPDVDLLHDDATDSAPPVPERDHAEEEERKEEEEEERSNYESVILDDVVLSDSSPPVSPPTRPIATTVALAPPSSPPQVRFLVCFFVCCNNCSFQGESLVNQRSSASVVVVAAAASASCEKGFRSQSFISNQK